MNWLPLIIPVTAIFTLPSNGRAGSASPVLTKRADPHYKDFDDPRADSTQIAKLMTGTNDAKVLAAFAVRFKKTYPDIWNKYFPGNVENGAMNVYRAILPDPSHPDQGGAALGGFYFDGVDHLHNTPGVRDVCAIGGDGYTINYESPPGDALADCHVCVDTFDEDPLYLTDQTCERFKDDDGLYRMSDKMNVLAATVLHEMTHYNIIGGSAYIPGNDALASMNPDNKDNYDGYDSLMWDIQKPAGDAYGARKLRLDDPDRCIKNADSYVWLALELYFTQVCWDKLQENGQGNFADPVDDSD